MSNTNTTTEDTATAVMEEKGNKIPKTNKVKPFSIKDISVGEKRIQLINPNDLHVLEGFNVRSDYGDIRELANDIKENGVKNPLRAFVKEGKLYIENGHRRKIAIEMLRKDDGVEVKSVPVMIEDRNSTDEQRLVNLILDNSGLPFKPIERARVFDRLANLGWTNQQIAQKFGTTLSTVSNMRILTTLPKKVENMIVNDTISTSYAMDVYKQVTEKEKGKAKEANIEVDVDKIHEKFVQTIEKAAEKVKALGKKRITKKVAERGTTRNVSRKNEKDSLIKLIQTTVRLLGHVKGKEAQDCVEAWDRYSAGLMGHQVVETE